MPAPRRVLLTIVALNDLAMFMLIFTISRSLAEAGADLWTMGLVGAAVTMAMGAGNILAGHLADRLGAKRVILGMELLMGLGALTCAALGDGHWAYYLAYIVCGLACGGVSPPAIALLVAGGDAVKDRGGVSGTLFKFCIAWNLGLIGGQVSGGLIHRLGGLWPTLLAAALALLCVLLLPMARALRVTSTPGTAASDLHLRHRELSAAFARLAWLANLAGTFAMSTIFNLAPSLMVELNIPADRHGGVLAYSRLVIIAMYLLMHRWVFWHHRFSTAAAAQALAVAGMLTVSWSQNLTHVALGLTGLSIVGGYNYFASLFYSTSGASEQRKGSAGGIHEATLSLGFAGGSLFGGWAGMVMGARAPYQLAAAVIALMLVIQTVWYFLAVRKTHHARRTALTPGRSSPP